jgi:1,4-alpha-glucan branching enzyme
MSEMQSFGATSAGDGRFTTFRLWAPDAHAVAIRIDPYTALIWSQGR